MTTLYVDNQPVEIPTGTLGMWLLKHCKPAHNRISLDTEASGKHVDGMWASQAAKCEPEARGSAVSMAWHTVGPVTHTVAIPFDQGRIGGKLGRYNAKLSRFEILPHTPECGIENVGKPVGTHCVCAPYNANADDWQALCSWLLDKRIDFFNAKYDMWIMLAGLRSGAGGNGHDCFLTDCVGWQHAANCPNRGVDLTDNLHADLMLIEAVRNPAELNSLEHVSRRLLGRGKDGDMAPALKANGVGLTKRYDLVPWPVTGPYAATDAELTLLGADINHEDYDCGRIEPSDMRIIDRETRKCKLLFTMERRGVELRIDEMRAEADKMQVELDKLLGTIPFQPPNNNTAAAYFFGPVSEGGLGVTPIKLTPGGKPSADAEVIARLSKMPGEAGRVAKEWAHAANLNSALVKWYRAWPERCGKDGRVRTNFRQTKMESDRADQTSGGAISGRLSADRVQLQGVPSEWRIPEGIKGVQQLIGAKPGHQRWEVDASNAEVRVGAWVSRCKKLADLINTGANIHDLNTLAIFGMALVESYPGGWPMGKDMHDLLTDEQGELVLDKEGNTQYFLSTHPEWKKYRVSAKRGIFGRMYGAGIRTLKSQIDADLKADIPERLIRAFMDQLDSAYPELKRTAKLAERKVDKSMGGCGYVRLVSGRRRVFGWGEKTYKAFNAVIQGGVSEMMSEFMLAVEDGWPGILLSQVHDSLWLEIPDAEVEYTIADIKALGKRLFEEAFSTDEIPLMFSFDAKRLA